MSYRQIAPCPDAPPPWIARPRHWGRRQLQLIDTFPRTPSYNAEATLRALAGGTVYLLASLAALGWWLHGRYGQRSC